MAFPTTGPTRPSERSICVGNSTLWGAEAGQPKHGGILRVRRAISNAIDRQALIDVGMEVELKLQELGASMATTYAGKYEGLGRSPYGIAWEPDNVLYRAYAPDSANNLSHVNDPKIAAMLKEQRRTKDLEARKKIIFDIQRYAAEQQYYVYTSSVMLTSSWQPYVKNFAPNLTFDYG